MQAEPPSLQQLGRLGETEIHVAVTTEPWVLPVEGLALLLTPILRPSNFIGRFLEVLGAGDRNLVERAIAGFPEAPRTGAAVTAALGPQVKLANGPVRLLLGRAYQTLDDKVARLLTDALLQQAVQARARSFAIPLIRWSQDPVSAARAAEALMEALSLRELGPLSRLVITTASPESAALLREAASRWEARRPRAAPPPVEATALQDTPAPEESPPPAPAEESAPVLEEAPAEEPPPLPPPPPTPGGLGFDIEFVDDDAELDADQLNRTPFAISVARRLHLIWRRLNVGTERRGSEARGAFVLHLDAPWGGGKTTFANFVGRVLEPYGPRGPALFLRKTYGEDADLATVFAVDPGAQAPPKLSRDALRPWILVEYNAWRAEHCAPPWWTFYEAIRKSAFRSVWRDGDTPATAVRGGRQPFVGRALRWLYLWLAELWWRLATPRLWIPLVGFLLACAAAVVLQPYMQEGKAPGTVAWSGRTVLGFVMAATAGITVLGGAAAVLVASIAPGVDPLAERLGLGRSDPLDRFRRHFEHTMARLRRPVLVVVDDLDRCRPEVIVDLVRGMQTILRSPRVVFLLLGSRTWIERAFETVHKDMAAAEIGEEQSVGARFVEKAIQMSFELPRMDAGAQAEYVRAKLGVNRNTTAAQPAAAMNVREQVRREAAARPSAAFDSEALRAQARENWASAQDYLREAVQILRGGLHDEADAPSEAEIRRLAEAQLDREINEELGIQAASSEAVESEATRRLAALSPWLPANPRQIKRIINAVSLYTAAALQHPTVQTSGDRWFQLALWIVLRTEWPLTWRLLASCPQIADALAAPSPVAALDALDPKTLPGSVAATRLQVERILADARLMALIAKAGRDEGPALDSAAIADLLKLAAPSGPPLRLPEPAKAVA